MILWVFRKELYRHLLYRVKEAELLGYVRRIEPQVQEALSSTVTYTQFNLTRKLAQLMNNVSINKEHVDDEKTGERKREYHLENVSFSLQECRMRYTRQQNMCLENHFVCILVFSELFDNFQKFLCPTPVDSVSGRQSWYFGKI